MNRLDLETALFALLGIAQVAFLLMLRGLWGNGIDLRFWVPVMALPLYLASAGALHVDLGRRQAAGGGFHGQQLIVALGGFMLVTGLLFAPQMTARTVSLIQLGVVAVGLGLASAVGCLLRRLRLGPEGNAHPSRPLS